MSKFNRGYKFRIYPTEGQAKQIDKYIDLFRYVYNWGIAKQEERYKQYKNGLCKYGSYNYMELCYLLQEERAKSENKWLCEIPLLTSKLALRNVINNYRRFFNKASTHSPRFKKKNKCKKSFNTRNNRFSLINDSIKIEGIKTRISLNFDSGLILNTATNPVISKDNLGNYYVSFNIEEESKSLNIPKTEGIGIDLGVRQTFTLSTGEIYSQPKEKLDKLDRRLKLINRHITRDVNRRFEESKHTKTKYEDIPKSKRAIKRELKRDKLYRKKHNIKDTFYHTITKRIVDRNPKFVCMETFRVRKIQRDNLFISDKISQVSFYDITQKVKEKCEARNIPFIQAPVEFPSTKKCNNCGNEKDLHGYHTYKCPVCGMKIDRDINAAINLMNYGSLIMTE